ncbi:MAG: Loki-CTERM sorting domain-containing protein [Promethearchaeota archaeon]|jgi:hypothetical protein
MKTKTKMKMIFFFLTIALIPGSLLLSIVNLSIGPVNIENIDEVADDGDTVAPLISAPQFEVASKNIEPGKGTQAGTWNQTNIRYDDGIYDQTNFQASTTGSHMIYAATSVSQATGVWGTNAGGAWNHGDVDNALLTSDANNLWVDATRAVWFDPDEFPGWVYIVWGGYPNFETKAHRNLYQIRISYDVWADSAPGILDHSSSLTLRIYDNLGNYQDKLLAATPGHRTAYIGTWTINSGTIYNNIRTLNGYIKNAAALIYANEEVQPFGTHVWININRFRIYYDFNKYDIDFEYNLDYDGLGLSTIDRFDYKIDLSDSVSGVPVYFKNFDTLTWELMHTTSSMTGEQLTGTITSNAERFFDGYDNIQIRFAKSNHYSNHFPVQYRFQVDQIKIDIHLPDIPANVNAENGILHAFLNWDPSMEYGAPLLHYNVYRGTTPGGVKSLVGSPVTNEFNDTTGVVGTLYYYTITANTSIGETANSTEVFAKSYDQPFVQWISPTDGETVIFPYNASDQFASWVWFNFEYDYEELDDVTLEIGGIDYGSVWNKSNVRFYPYLDGPRTAILHGLNQSVELCNDSITINFVRIVHEITEMLDFGSELMGQQLYLILHDPSGDNSYSSYSETTTLSIGVGYEITTAEASHVEIGASFDLFGIVSAGASGELVETNTEAEGFDFRFEVSDITSITSNQESNNPDYIGPGYGDVYWGEAWIFKWVLNATRRVYSNDTNDVQYEDPKMFYGILRDAETLVNDVNAPTNWRNQNPVHNNWDDVDWAFDPLICYGTIPYEKTFAVETTIGRTQTIEVEIESEAAANAGIFGIGGGGSITITETKKNYKEIGLGHEIETGYYIYDDEPTDTLVVGRGIDRRFGTYIFNTSDFLCETSLPLEHETFDYIPPLLEFPDIDLDTDNDLLGPTPLDSPYVTVEIFEEGGIQDAIINYSIDDGLNWDIIHLVEQSANPGTWAASIPSQTYNTTVRWYIMAWDAQGSKAIRTNATGYPFSYTVLPQPPADIPAVPGYSVPITIVSLVAITIIYYRKRKK